MLVEDFQACLRHGIANILVGRIVWFNLLANTKAKLLTKLSFWKQSPIWICTYGTIFLVKQDR
jgi:hypothetical protein